MTDARTADSRPTAVHQRDLPERLDARSQDITAERIAKLREDFPEVFREGRIDFDSLKRSLGEWVDPGKERFGLTWPGKAACMKTIQQPSVGTLLPDRAESVDFDATGNAIIEGDNLEVLKLLQKGYHGKVKLIYIDPPYNTGNEFIYPDNFTEGLRDYLRYSGQVDGDGLKLTTNTESEGRYHSNWLNMMYPRLYLARNLLRNDGVIFVSIDDHEVDNLRLLMDEVFGEENFVATLVWQARTSISNDQLVSLNHHYVVVYAKLESQVGFSGQALDASEYSNPDADTRGPWKPVPLDANKPGGDTYYPVKNPNTEKEFFPPNGRSWAINSKEMERLLRDGRLSFGVAGTSAPKRKMFLVERMERGDTKTPSSLLLDVGTTQSGTAEVMKLFGTKAFDYPKPTGLLRRLLEFGAGPEDIVLDFFAGSGTTAHAVIDQNAQDNGSRRFLLVQLPEATDIAEYPTVSAITRERVRRAGATIAAERNGKLDLDGRGTLDTGFRAYKLAASSFLPWDGAPARFAETPHQPGLLGPVTRQLGLAAENVVPGRTPEDILTEILLRTGYELTVLVETIELAGQRVFSVADGALLACLEPAIRLETVEAMAERKPAQIVCLDTAFGGDDALKINAVQAVRSRGRGRTGDEDVIFRTV